MEMSEKEPKSSFARVIEVQNMLFRYSVGSFCLLQLGLSEADRCKDSSLSVGVIQSFTVNSNKMKIDFEEFSQWQLQLLFS